MLNTALFLPYVASSLKSLDCVRPSEKAEVQRAGPVPTCLTVVVVSLRPQIAHLRTSTAEHLTCTLTQCFDAKFVISGGTMCLLATQPSTFEGPRDT